MSREIESVRRRVTRAVERCLDRGDLVQASKTLASQPESPWVLALRGDIAYESGDRVAAAECYRLALDGGERDVALRLGNILADEGHIEAATATYRAAAEAGDPRGWRNLALTLQETQAAVAEDAFRRAIDGGDIRSALLLGEFLIDRNRIDEAIPILFGALTEGDAEASIALGLIFINRGDSATAEDVLRQGVSLGSPCAVAPYLGTLLTDASRFDEAETLYRTVLGTEPTCDDVLLNLGNLLSERPDPSAQAEAEQFYERAVSLGKVEALYNLAVLLEQQGRVAAALTSYKRAADQGDALAKRRLDQLR